MKNRQEKLTRQKECYIYAPNDSELSHLFDENLMLFSFLNYLEDDEFRKLFDLPLEIKGSESPDFIINGNIGVEVSSAIPRNYRYALHLYNNDPEALLLEITPELLSTDKLSKVDVMKTIKRANQRLGGKPFINNGKELQWAKCVIRIIKDKTAKLNQNYSKLELNILLINADIGIIKNSCKAKEFLEDQFKAMNMKDENESARFDHIFVFARIRSLVVIELK